MVGQNVLPLSPIVAHASDTLSGLGHESVFGLGDGSGAGGWPLPRSCSFFSFLRRAVVVFDAFFVVFYCFFSLFFS